MNTSLNSLPPCGILPCCLRSSGGRWLGLMDVSSGCMMRARRRLIDRLAVHELRHCACRKCKTEKKDDYYLTNAVTQAPLRVSLI